jgi:serine protease Do
MKWAFAALLVLILPALAQAEVPRSREAIRLSFAPVVREVAPAVVNIQTARDVGARDPFRNDPFFQFFFGPNGPGAPRQRVENALGSGVILDPAGLVVTNHHVIEGADEITVILADRRSFPARIVLRDERSDLAILRIDPQGERLPTVAFADSDAIEVGDLVLAIGNPFGIGQSVTSGIVSATNRTAQGLERDVSFIQTDAAINPGNSGGALVDVDGRLIGINTAIFSRSGGSIGIGFAIPSNLVKVRLETARRGRADLAELAPWLGARTVTVDPDTAAQLGQTRPQGVLVQRVHKRGAAARAGLLPGDVILRVDRVAVDTPAALNYRLSLRPLGSSVPLTVLRRGRELSLDLPVEPAPEASTTPVTLPRGHPLAGAVVVALSPRFNERQGIDPFETGVIVLDRERGSPAARLGLVPGDIIVELAGRAIETVDDLLAAGRGAGPQATLSIRRNGRTLQGTLG